MKKGTLLDKIVNTRQYMMLFSLIVAFLFWFFIVATISPNSTRTITGVPVTVDTSSGFISSAGLQVIEETSSKISVDVSGPRYIIGNLTPSDFVITPDLAKVTQSGKYTLKLDASLKKPNSKVSIVKLSPSSTEFRFDTIVSKSVNIEVRVNVVNGSKIDDNYVMEAASVSPKQVVVTGPSDEVSKVARAVTTIQVDSGSKSTVSSKNPLSLYDANSNLLTLEHSKMDIQSATATVPILKKAQLPLTLDFTNIPSGFDKNNIKVTINPANITVAGEEKFISAQTSVKLASIDFNTLDITNSLADDVALLNGETNVDNITSANVSISLLNTATKLLSTKDFKIINMPSGWDARVRTTQLNNIKLFGPASDIGSVTSVTATVDMSTLNLVEGTYEVPVTISVPGKTGYWVTSKYTVMFNAWKK